MFEAASKRTCLLSSVFCALLLASGCASTSDMDSLKNQITGLNVELAGQKRAASEMRSALAEVTKDVPALKERTEGVVKEYAFTAIRESQSSLLAQTADLSKELQTLKGRFDENKYFMDRTIKDLTAEKDLLQAKMSAIENELKALRARLEGFEKPEKPKEDAPPQVREQAPAAPAAPAPPAAEAKAADGDQGDPQRTYDDAQIDFREKRYPEARRKFEKFAADHPKHQLVPNSYFWIGETFYAEKKYDDAILAYENLLKKHPEHEKVRGAMLKQAYSFIDMGDRKTGKVILERLIEKYPTSKEAELAEKKIAEVLKNNNGSARNKGKKKKK